MDLGELRKLVRTRLDDVNQPYLWSDKSINDALNRAQEEAVFRGAWILDSSTASVVRIPYSAGDVLLPIHSSIEIIKSAQIEGEPKPLDPATLFDLERHDPYWRDQTGTPQAFVRENWTLRIFPKPIEAGVIKLEVLRTPLEPMTSDGDEPEINARYHEPLTYWALHEMFNVRDADTYGVNEAARYEQKFERIFGPRPTAKHESFNRNHVHGSTVYKRRFGR